MEKLTLPLESQVCGEFEIRIKNKDGEVIREIPKQRNLLLDNFYLFALGFQGKTGIKNNKNAPITIVSDSNLYNATYVNTYKTSFMSNLIIGIGNSNPTKSQYKLDQAIAVNSSATNLEGTIIQPTENKPNIFSLVFSRTFTFTNVGNKNITEVGLTLKAESNDYTTLDKYENDRTYILASRALIKNSDGHPTALTLTNEEILEVTYYITFYYDLTPKKTTMEIKVQKDRLNPQLTETKQFDVLFQIINPKLLQNQGGTKSYPFVFLAGENSDNDISPDYDLEKRWSLKYSLPEGQEGRLGNKNIYLHAKEDEQVTRDMKNSFHFSNITGTRYQHQNGDFYSNQYTADPINTGNLSSSSSLNGTGIKLFASDPSSVNEQLITLKMKPYMKELSKGFRAIFFVTSINIADIQKLDCFNTYDIKGDTMSYTPWFLVAFKEQSTGLGLVKPMGYILEIDFKFTLSEYQG